MKNVGLSLLCPTTEEPSCKALWSMLMLTTDDSAIYFCGTEAVCTVSLQNDFPEITQHVWYVCMYGHHI